MQPMFRHLAGLAAIALALLSPMPAYAQTNRVTFPANFEQMAMYGDYRRGSDGELAYALQETIDIAQAGLPLPPGTVLVLEIYRNDVLTDYFVMEKSKGWGLDFAEEQRTGDWHFQQLDSSMTVRRTAFADRCMVCAKLAAIAARRLRTRVQSDDRMILSSLQEDARLTNNDLSEREPAIGQVQMYLVTQPPLRADAEAISDDEHADEQFRIDRRQRQRRESAGPASDCSAGAAPSGLGPSARNIN